MWRRRLPCAKDTRKLFHPPRTSRSHYVEWSARREGWGVREEQRGRAGEDSLQVGRHAVQEGSLRLKELGRLVVELQLELGQWPEGRH